MKITRFVIHKAMVEEELRWLEEALRGQDPAGIEDHWDRMYYRLSRWREGAVIQTALSAVDMALWDIEGKRLGVPGWRLLGGAIHKKLRVYFTHCSASLQTQAPEEFGELALRTREKGEVAAKSPVPIRLRRRTVVPICIPAIAGEQGSGLNGPSSSQGQPRMGGDYRMVMRPKGG